MSTIRQRTPIAYLALLVFLTIVSVASRELLDRLPDIAREIDFQLLVGGGMLFTGYLINRVAPATRIPSFVWAIFAGMAMQPLLAFSTRDLSSLRVLMELFGAIVLFAGGLEVPWGHFKRWFFPIASLSFVGVIVSSVGFAAILYVLADAFGVGAAVLVPSIVIVSAALASTDPTAIIPTLQALHLKRSYLKQIAISESALTDVSGSILTRFLLIAVLGGGAVGAGLFSPFAALLRKASYDALALQIISGIIVGYVGFRVLRKFYSESRAATGSSRIDPALLIAVPIFTFVVGNVLGGAGFLAAFVSGLLSEARSDLRRASHFSESLLDHLIKPFIFLVLGALVPLAMLIDLAPIGIIAGLLFMFVVRPFVVTVSLLPWIVQGRFHVRDILFLSFIRETGIIAAILLIMASANPLIASDFAIAIGMWIILMTLVIEPPLTPAVARAIGVAHE